MGVRLKDLPPDVRKRVEAEHGAPEKKPSKMSGTGGPQEVTCQTCKQVFQTWPKAERHSQAERHMDQRITLR